jgi:Rad3-related DNA helicase
VTGDLQRQLDQVTKLIGAEDVDSKSKRLANIMKKLESRLAILKGIDDSNRVVSLQFNGDFCDMVAEPARAFTQEKLARVEVFTSATLAPVARLLHIEPEWVKIFPEIFDWSKNVTLSPLPDQEPGTRKNRALDADLLSSLYDQPGRPTTIALFFSKAHTKAATAGIAGQPGVFIQGEDSEVSLGELVERAKAYGPGAFVCTYGGWVGLDFPGQKWLILGSVPKSPLSAAVEGRAAQNRTSPWNDFERNALDRLQLAQGLGRALRTETDQAVLLWVNNQAARDAGLDPHTGRLRA